jgi:hypothetical protein
LPGMHIYTESAVNIREHQSAEGGDIIYDRGFTRLSRLAGLTLMWLFLVVIPLQGAHPDDQVQITFNEGLFLPQYPLYFNSEGRLMIAAEDAARLLEYQLDWVDNNQIQLACQDISVSLRAGIPEAIYNYQIVIFSPAPLKMDDILYLPLRSTAELLDFTVVWDMAHHSANVYSPGIPIPTPPEPLSSQAPAGLPTWGSCATTPGLENCWPEETLLSSYYTTLLDRSAGRTKNVELSCQAINGLIIQPGQVVSFNQISGPRTKERGYQVAPIFVDRKVVPGRGGGVCQTSSTLYNSVLEAGLEVVERHPHSLPVAYVAPGRDATVSWGGADLQFRNNQEVPVKILARVWDNYVLCAIAAII